jgi:hypothetical protein
MSVGEREIERGAQEGMDGRGVKLVVEVEC